MSFVGGLPRRGTAAIVVGACALGLSLAAITIPSVALASPAGPTDSKTSERSVTDSAPRVRAHSAVTRPEPSARGGEDRRPAAASRRPARPAARPGAAEGPPQVPVAQPAQPSVAAASAPLAPTGQTAPTGKAAGALPMNPIGNWIEGALQLARRTVFNQAPTAAPVQAMTRPSGQIWGFVAGGDREGDPITYSVKRNPRFGTVAVSANGVYSYTPGPGFTGSDSFTVTLANPRPPGKLLNLFGGPRRDVRVNVKASTGSPAGTVVDTFDGAAGSAPDPALWGYHLGPWRDHGLQTYTDSPDNVRLDGQGNLVMQARNTPDGYTSTRLVTQDKLEMQYGTVEARIKMPAGQGIWPSFWMLGTSYYPEFWERWPECGEIDIMELVNTGTKYTVALHGPQGETDYYGGVETGRFVGNQGPIAAVAPITDLSADFHDYWLMWREDHIVIGVDNTMLGDFTPASLPAGAEWVFNQKMYGILQIAVGGPWAGPPDATTPWPATMLVDSFRYTPLT